jgi:hypothetical protein
MEQRHARHVTAPCDQDVQQKDQYLMLRVWERIDADRDRSLHQQRTTKSGESLRTP